MTKLAFALGLLNHLRQQKNPPYARFCVLLALAEPPRRNLTARQIFTRFGMDQPSAGTLDCSERQGLIEKIPASPVPLYAITPAGEKIVAAMLNSATEPAEIPT